MATDTDSTAPPVKQPTPGPWKVWRSVSDGSVNIVNAHGEYVCLVGREKAGEADVDQIRADAQMICAAPELLAALKQARREYGAFGTLTGETLVQLDSAIVRAEGREAVRA